MSFVRMDLLMFGAQVTYSRIGGRISACECFVISDADRCPIEYIFIYFFAFLTKKVPVTAPTSETTKSIFGIAAAKSTERKNDFKIAVIGRAFS